MSDPIVFPHLDGGAIAQLPIRLTIERLIPRLLFPEGSEIRDSQNSLLRYSWSLAYDNLSDAEWQRFRSFIALTGHGARSFAFPDPLGNLLAASRDLTASVWLASPGLTVAPFADPGQPAAFILTNPTPAPLSLSQSVSLSGPFAACFSLRARWTSPVNFSISLGDDSGSTPRICLAGPWRSFHVSHSPAAAPSSRIVSITVPATTQILVAAPQLEIAFQPGAYHATSSDSGLFPHAWLDQSDFVSQSNAPGAHSISLRIVSQRSL
ncbi:MAG: hypothetical protein ACK50U_14055 [Acidobacteriota bacterium]